MNPYVAYLVTASGGAALVLGVAYARFRNGLAFKMFAALVPLLAIVGGLGFAMGDLKSPEMFVIAAVVGIILAWVILYWLYKTMVVRLQGFANSVLTSATQLSATARQTAAESAPEGAPSPRGHVPTW